MSKTPEPSNLPAQIADALSGIPKSLVPASLKALDRLLGAAVDIPVAWLAQKKAQIEGQTQSYVVVEQAIANAAAAEAGGNIETVRNAVSVLVRSAYRKQANREAVAAAMVEDLRSSDASQPADASTPPPPLDEDWLNVFERYAEDASTERMQRLWGRVLAGEVRKPGRYSMRTLRFLSEFSQSDGLLFAEYCNSAFGATAPTALVKPATKKDIRDLLSLESAGLIQGPSVGLHLTMTFNGEGWAFIREGSLLIGFKGTPGAVVQFATCPLTPLGQELMSLLPDRNPQDAARAVANAVREPLIQSALLLRYIGVGQPTIQVEKYWEEEPEQPSGASLAPHGTASPAT